MDVPPSCRDAGADAAGGTGEETGRPGDVSNECKGDGSGTENTPSEPVPGQDEQPVAIGDPATTDGDTAIPKPEETALPADKADEVGNGSEPGDAAGAGEGAESKKGAARPEWF